MIKRGSPKTLNRTGTQSFNDANSIDATVDFDRVELVIVVAEAVVDFPLVASTVPSSPGKVVVISLVSSVACLFDLSRMEIDSPSVQINLCVGVE